MVYATKADMLKRYEERELIQLTDNIEPYTGEIVDSILDNALTDACAMIDLFLGGRYDLPLAETPPALVNMACTIAFHDLNRRSMTDEIRAAYDDVQKILDKISKGIIPLDAGGSEPKSAAAIAKVNAPDRTFNRDSLKGF